MGRLGGIIIIWDPQVLERVDSHIGTFSVCCKLKSLSDNFVWGLLGVYGPNGDNLRSVFFF